MPAPKDPDKAEEWRRKLSDKAKLRLGGRNSFFGKKHSDDSLLKMSEAHRNRTEGWRRKQSDVQKGRKASEETRSKMSVSRKGRKRPEKMQELLRTVRKGAKHTDESRSKMSASLRNSEALKVARESGEYIRKQRMAHSGERSHLWKGGVSFEPYCPKFNNDLKERVRAFFGYMCRQCNIPQKDKKLSVHHVYYNKQACCVWDEDLQGYYAIIDGERYYVKGDPYKFIPLCDKCHKKTYSKRFYWAKKFESLINDEHGGKSYFTKDEMSKLCKKNLPTQKPEECG
jgi:hypothetical protein